MLLSDLLADSSLGLVLRAGDDQVDRAIRDVYVTDLIDPRRYLDGGELVLTGLVWHNEPGDSERFVAALADAGVAGLAAGTARLGRTPDDLVEACRVHRLPIVEVPVSVSFNTLTERIAREHRRASASQRGLVSAIASGADLEQVLAMASGELDADCWVLSATGWRVGGAAELPERARNALTRAYLESDRIPRTVFDDSDTFALWPGGTDTEPCEARWFVAMRSDSRQWTEKQEAVAVELGTVVALVRARIDEARRIAGRSVESILRRLLEGTASPPEVVASLETAGLPTGEPLRVVTLSTAKGDESTTVLREIAASTGLPSVTAPLRDGASALFVDDERHLAGLDEHLSRVLTEMRLRPNAPAIALGSSETSSVNGLRGALDEANYACRIAERRPGGSGFATGAELASHQALLASVPDELRISYTERLLATLIDYDRRHHSDLVRTLRAFLDLSGSWSRCAKTLHVHVNTLRYRIRRIEEITGRDLSDFPARVDFYLALQLARADSDRTGTPRQS